MELTQTEKTVLTQIASECRRIPNTWIRPLSNLFQTTLDSATLQQAIQRLLALNLVDQLPGLDGVFLSVKINPTGEALLVQQVKPAETKTNVNQTFNVNSAGQINTGGTNTQNIHITIKDVIHNLREEVEQNPQATAPEKKSALQAIDTVLRHPLLQTAISAAIQFVK